jgi:hypothetical protein
MPTIRKLSSSAGKSASENAAIQTNIDLAKASGDTEYHLASEKPAPNIPAGKAKRPMPTKATRDPTILPTAVFAAHSLGQASVFHWKGKQELAQTNDGAQKCGGTLAGGCTPTTKVI